MAWRVRGVVGRWSMAAGRVRALLGAIWARWILRAAAGVPRQPEGRASQQLHTHASCGAVLPQQTRSQPRS